MIRFGRRAACLAIAAIAFLQVSGCAGTPAAQEPVHIKIAISEKASIFLSIAGDELRMSTSADDLEDAPAIKAMEKEFKGQPPIFLNVPLVIPADLLPPGITGAQATVTAGRNLPEDRLPGVSGKLVTKCVGDDGAAWSYVQQFYYARATTGTVKVPMVASLMMQNFALRVNPIANKDGATGIEIVLTAGATVGPEPKQTAGADLEALMRNGKFGTVLTDANVQKNGAPIEVSLRVLDEDGKEIMTDKGPLSKFGFS